MTTPSLSLYELKRGDNDRQQTWGGRKRQDIGNFVAQLQQALKSAGIPVDTVDGAFGPATERALKMFQWGVASHPYRISHQAVTTDTQTIPLPISGRLDSQTGRELTRWVRQS